MELNPELEERTVLVDGRRVAYTARGPENAEYAYVGLNGLLGGADSFWPVIEGVPGDWRVVLPDLPGCGGSETMAEPLKHDIEGYTRWLERFLAELGLDNKKVVLASITTAAPISIRYCFDHKDRIAGQVLHMPFLGKLGIAAKWARPIVAYSLLVAPSRKLVDSARQSDAVMHRLIQHEPPMAIPVMAERDIHHKQQGDLVAAGELLHDLMLTDARTELPWLHSPILILASEHDFSAPVPVLEQIVQGRPERKLYVYRGGQHSWNEEFINDMNREIAAFLASIETMRT